jgi:hypothetical protein
MARRKVDSCPPKADLQRAKEATRRNLARKQRARRLSRRPGRERRECGRIHTAAAISRAHFGDGVVVRANGAIDDGREKQPKKGHQPDASAFDSRHSR